MKGSDMGYSVSIILTDEDSGEELDSASRSFEDLEKAQGAFEDSRDDMLCMD
jgi:hypothetical protein